jgi:hypothetical protein
MNSANTLDQLLAHVIEVELEMVHLSAESHKKITQWINESNLIPSNNIIEAMQYQDILAQQLSATCDALSSIRNHLEEIFSCSSNESRTMIDNQMVRILEEAKFKRSAFSGKIGQTDDQGIEFF